MFCNLGGRESLRNVESEIQVGHLGPLGFLNSTIWWSGEGKDLGGGGGVCSRASDMAPASLEPLLGAVVAGFCRRGEISGARGRVDRGRGDTGGGALLKLSSMREESSVIEVDGRRGEVDSGPNVHMELILECLKEDKIINRFKMNCYILRCAMAQLEGYLVRILQMGRIQISYYSDLTTPFSL